MMFCVCSRLDALMWPHIASRVDDARRKSLSMGRTEVRRCWESDVGTVAGTSACGFCPNKRGSRVRGRGCSARGRAEGVSGEASQGRDAARVQEAVQSSLVSMGNWFRDPHRYQNPWMLEPLMENGIVFAYNLNLHTGYSRYAHTPFPWVPCSARHVANSGFSFWNSLQFLKENVLICSWFNLWM